MATAFDTSPPPGRSATLSSFALRAIGGWGVISGECSEDAVRSDAPRGTASILPWCALLLGFSPVLADLVANWRLIAEDRATLLVLVLLAAALVQARSRPASRPRADGLVWIAAGAALELFGVVANAWSLARFGLPLAAVGLARYQGRPALAVVALAFGVVPLPDTVLGLTSPALESQLGAAAVATARVLGAGSVRAAGPSLVAPDGRIDLEPADGGLPLAALLACTGWFLALRREAAPRGLVAGAVRGGLWAVPAQPLGLLGVVLLLEAGAPGAAWAWLRYGIAGVACGALLAAGLASQRVQRRAAIDRTGGSGPGTAPQPEDR